MNEDKATRYHRLRRRADLLGAAAAGALLLVLLLTRWTFTLREAGSIVGAIIGRGFEEPGTVVGVSTALAILQHMVELPFALYQHGLDRRYELSTQSLIHWSRDYGKAMLIGTGLLVLGASVVYAALRWQPDWWWAIAFATFAAGMIGLVHLAPVVLLPMFYRVAPLDRPGLTHRLLALAGRTKTPVLGVYEWTLSAHTKKANAALAGIGRTRRILLSDTLLSGYTDDEIEVVLAHELSHHVHHDLWRSMALASVLLVSGFLGAHVVLRELSGPLELRGVDDPAGLPLLLLVAGVASALFMPVGNALSRAHERRADRFALEITGHPEAFVSAMKRLSQQNLAEERPSRLVQWLFYSHPPIRERIESARRWRRGDVNPGEVA
ncbi:MAG: M48 family metallopeptidase [Acidobacteriota bacterium]